METILVVLLMTGICQGMPATDPIPQLEDYLYQYGYLPVTDRENGVKRSEMDLDQATMSLQKFMGLEVTGKLDEPTLELIGKPRCGMPDMVVKDDDLQGIVEVNDGPSNYTLEGGMWTDMPVKYGLVNSSSDLPKRKVKKVIKAAIKMWTDESSQLKGKYVKKATKADIQISFGTGSHGTCEYAFEGGVLAHAYYPGSGVGGDCHFNEAHTFTIGTDSGDGYDLMWVAVHEFGHSFGIGHSGVSDAVMFPYYNYVSDMQLTSDDIAAIVAKYGE